MRVIWKLTLVLWACSLGAAGCDDEAPKTRSSTRQTGTRPKDVETRPGLLARLFAKAAPKPKHAGSLEMHFQCVDCGHTFVLTADELNAAAPNVMMEEAGAIRVKCPKCGKEKSAYPATKCPKCEKYFLAENTKREAKILADMDADMDAAKEAGQTYERPRYELVKNVCPHCGQDIAEWYREKYRRKKKK